VIGTIVLAIGFVLIIEGLAYVLAPSIIEELLKALSQLSLAKRRQFGFLVLALGVVIAVFAYNFLLV
jgi:uncharacterized protein YjeT (DUF2065 family)